MARILLINDEDDLLFVYRLTLENAGHIVEDTTSADEAIERAKQFRPEVIGMDWVLPGGTTGAELLRRFRELPETRSVPILVISAIQGLEQRARSLGADATLAKPFKPNHLIEAFQSLLGHVHRVSAQL
jgi:two-component system, OmpR family, alkaline phosphatase synthesis response regulator PhoP